MAERHWRPWWGAAPVLVAGAAACLLAGCVGPAADPTASGSPAAASTPATDPWALFSASGPCDTPAETVLPSVPERTIVALDDCRVLVVERAGVWILADGSLVRFAGVPASAWAPYVMPVAGGFWFLAPAPDRGAVGGDPGTFGFASPAGTTTWPWPSHAVEGMGLAVDAGGRPVVLFEMATETGQPDGTVLYSMALERWQDVPGLDGTHGLSGRGLGLLGDGSLVVTTEDGILWQTQDGWASYAMPCPAYQCPPLSLVAQGNSIAVQYDIEDGYLSLIAAGLAWSNDGGATWSVHDVDGNGAGLAGFHSGSLIATLYTPDTGWQVVSTQDGEAWTPLPGAAPAIGNTSQVSGISLAPCGLWQVYHGSSDHLTYTPFGDC